MNYNSNFDDILDRFFGNSTNTYYKTSLLTKGLDDNYEINQTNDGAYLFFEVPGFNKSNLKVEMENGFLIIEGKRTYKLNGEDKTKSVNKEFKIGDRFNPDEIEATIEDGLLTVFVPNFKKQDKKRINLL